MRLQEGTHPVDGPRLQFWAVQGNTVISSFGQCETMSMDVWSGCAATSSARTSIGVWHVRAKSRDTLYTKSGRRR